MPYLVQITGPERPLYCKHVPRSGLCPLTADPDRAQRFESLWSARFAAGKLEQMRPDARLSIRVVEYDLATRTTKPTDDPWPRPRTNSAWRRPP